MLLTLPLLLALAPAIAPAGRQAAPAPALERVAFAKLAERLLGTWVCEIRQYNANGALEWSDAQTRVFMRSFLGHGVEERAYKAPKLAAGDNLGLHVLLLQSPGFGVTHYGIWLDSAAQMFMVEGVLRKDGSGFDGTMTATDAKGVQDKRRVAMEWFAPDSHTYRVFSRDPQGREYLLEELIYRRPASN